MSSGLLVTKKRVRVEYYIQPGVSVTNPAGAYEIDCEETLENIGSRFLKDVKEPGQEKSALDDLIVSWAVVRGEDTLLSFGMAQTPVKDTGLFAILDVGFQLILIPRGNMSATIGLEEVECPPDVDPSGCCVVS
eukprot:TRINITY_DN15455_c0_g1_i2.p1 TRINITY_DN15455_c0_g1~~TRINITY_DN15455_c0_g1_i2.p1  ORF type:complete len:134 (+),score=24.16 TRINITY_DN15455_c0_g1_i2:58-459(+)